MKGDFSNIANCSRTCEFQFLFMLVHMFPTNVEIISHFACLVCFLQISGLNVFWSAWRFYAIEKKWIKEFTVNFV
jgi:hypothetical protein